MKIIIIIIEMKKYIFVLQNGWATAQLYCEKFCIAMQGSALQEVPGLRGFYVAIQ